MNKPCSKRTPLKKYQHVKHSVISFIIGNNIQEGRKIPSENELVDQLGISRTTVRQALNELENERILIRERGRGTFLSPNVYIRNNKIYGKTGRIGVIIRESSYLTIPSISMMLHGITCSLSESQYHTTISTIISEDGSSIKNYHALLNHNNVDGIILYDQILAKDEILKIQKSSIPFVLIDRIIPGVDIPVVRLNYFNGFYKATKYLLEIGHTDICCIIGSLDIEIDNERVQGYRKALEENGFSFNPDNVFETTVNNTLPIGTNHSKEFGISSEEYNRYCALFEAKRIPGALISSSDHTGLCVTKYLARKGIKIPEDVSHLIFGATAINYGIEPTPTRFQIPFFEMGMAAANMVTDLINTNLSQPEVTFSAVLKEGKTCKSFNTD